MPKWVASETHCGISQVLNEKVVTLKENRPVVRVWLPEPERIGLPVWLLHLQGPRLRLQVYRKNVSLTLKLTAPHASYSYWLAADAARFNAYAWQGATHPTLPLQSFLRYLCDFCSVGLAMHVMFKAKPPENGLRGRVEQDTQSDVIRQDCGGSWDQCNLNCTVMLVVHCVGCPFK